MIGFCDVNPAHIGLIIDRKHHWPHTIMPDAGWQAKLHEYMKIKNVYARTRVIVVDDLAVVAKLHTECADIDFSQVVVLLASDMMTMSKVDGIVIADMIQIGQAAIPASVDPEIFNKLIGTAPRGLGSMPRLDTKVAILEDIKADEVKKPVKVKKIPKKKENADSVVITDPVKPVPVAATAEPPKFFDNFDKILESITDDQGFFSSHEVLAQYFEGMIEKAELSSAFSNIKQYLGPDKVKEIDALCTSASSTELLGKFRKAVFDIVIKKKDQKNTAADLRLRNWDLNWLNTYSPFEQLDKDKLKHR